MPKENNNQVAPVSANPIELKGALKTQSVLLNELDKANEEFGTTFTEYGRTCAVNCIAGIVSYCRSNGIPFEDLDGALLKLQVQNVGFTELNYASIPSEIYFDFRKTTIKDKDGKEKDGYMVSIKPQGAGNEKLVRKYGVGLKQGTGLHTAILIHEGDEYELPQFDGLNITPFKYKPKLENMNNKVIAVCYPVEKKDGSVEYLIATRESVKANLIAQIRQNALYKFFKETEYTGKNGQKYKKKEVDKDARDKFYADVDEKAKNMSVDDMLDDEQFAEYINPTYTSGGSKEAMILRKMKNNALKNYPKEYDNSYIADSVRNMFEENDTSVLERKDVVKKVEREIEEDSDDVAMDFTANDDPKPNDVDEQPKPKDDDEVPF